MRFLAQLAVVLLLWVTALAAQEPQISVEVAQDAVPVGQPVMLRWSWLLGVSLLGPAALPAGGAERRLPQVRRHQGSGPLLSGDRCVLQASPRVAAPALLRLEVGTPL